MWKSRRVVGGVVNPPSEVWGKAPRALQSLAITTPQQARILTPDIGQCPAKNWVMSDENCFTTGPAVRLEFKKLL